MARVLVTGASGFIGRHVLEQLTGAGDEVVAVSSGPVADPALAALPGVHWRQADLLDPGVPAALCDRERPTHVVHLAWFATPGATWTSPENVRWVEASLRLLRAFGVAGGQRAVFAGTCAEYDWSYGLCSELRTPTEPASLYGAAKDGLRRVALAAAADAGIDLAWARPFFLYGRHEDPRRLVPAIALPLLRGHEAPTSEGSQLRDYLHVADAAAALAALLHSGVSGPVNVGSGVPVRVREIVARIGQRTGRPDLIRYGALGDGAGGAPVVLADTGRLRDEVGWRPRIGLDEGLDDVVAFWRSTGGGAESRD